MKQGKGIERHDLLNRHYLNTASASSFDNALFNTEEQIAERRERLPNNRKIQVRSPTSLQYPFPHRFPRSNILDLFLPTRKSYWNQENIRSLQPKEIG